MTNEQIYITIDPFTLKLRHYPSIELALQNSVDLNNADDRHPAFELYELKSDKVDLIKIGTLSRRFGTDDFSFVDVKENILNKEMVK